MFSIVSISILIVVLGILQLIKPLSLKVNTELFETNVSNTSSSSIAIWSPLKEHKWIEDIDCETILGENEQDFPYFLGERLANQQLKCRKDFYELFCDLSRNLNSTNLVDSFDSDNDYNPADIETKTGYNILTLNSRSPQEKLAIAARLNETFSRIWSEFPGHNSLKIAWSPDVLAWRHSYETYDTSYGCPKDPTIIAMQAATPTTLREKNSIVNNIVEAVINEVTRPIPTDISPTAILPHKIALLFLINGSLKHERIWISWLQTARDWSRSLFDQRIGPYKSLGPNAEFTPLYSLHVHLKRPQSSFYGEVQRIWKNWGLSSSSEAFNKFFNNSVIPLEFEAALVPEVESLWGNLNACQNQLLTYAMRDPHSSIFIFISDTTVPVKPFKFIYEEFEKNQKSRIFFSNTNLPIVQKHHQWIILSRQHAHLLVTNPTKWVCHVWLYHKYPSPWGFSFASPAAPDEYLPFYALTEILGISKVLGTINDGKQRDLKVFNNTGKSAASVSFRHTWLCWSYNDIILGQVCGDIGVHGLSIESPVSYRDVFAPQFEKVLITHRSTWFARKFTKDTSVSYQSIENAGLRSVYNSSRIKAAESNSSLALWNKLLKERTAAAQKQHLTSSIVQSATADSNIASLNEATTSLQIQTKADDDRFVPLADWIIAVLDDSYFQALQLTDNVD